MVQSFRLVNSWWFWSQKQELLSRAVFFFLQVFCWNIRRTFMAILSVRADFCQAQHSILADK